MAKESDVNYDDPKFLITTQYNSQPKFVSRNELLTHQKKSLKRANDESNQEAVKKGYNDDVEKRLYEREMNKIHYFATQSIKNYGHGKSKTKTEMIESKRQSLIKSNVEKFAHFPKGVHGHELPNYQGTSEAKYWEQHKDYVKQPKYGSQGLLLQER